MEEFTFGTVATDELKMIWGEEQARGLLAYYLGLIRERRERVD